MLKVRIFLLYIIYTSVVWIAASSAIPNNNNNNKRRLSTYNDCSFPASGTYTMTSHCFMQNMVTIAKDTTLTIIGDENTRKIIEGSWQNQFSDTEPGRPILPDGASNNGYFQV